MPLIGLVGYPLGHSFSPKYFSNKFKELNIKDWEYKAFPIKNINDINQLVLDNSDLIAFNVTIPHKESILDYCEFLSEEVEEIGACNLVLVERTIDNRISLSAYNTDHYGFSKSLKSWLKHKPKKALVLGSGGSSKAVQYALKQWKVEFDEVGRTSFPIQYKNLNLKSYDLIINCTPVGMYQEHSNQNKILPLPYEKINSKMHFFDLVYNPIETEMMKLFADRNAQVKNGIEMLHLQANRTWEIVSNLK
ncbi:MAG: shikimate dehydrogenase [Bacteroidia bacterium]